MTGLFAKCSSLMQLDLSNFDTSGVKDMSWMFANCSALESLDLSGFDVRSVEKSECMFMGCRKLRRVAVRGCSPEAVALIRANIAGANLSGVEVIG